jgi:1-acyl-sn-glycerol-3-phosphate acyltransferase
VTANYGLDADRVLGADSPLAALRRRTGGHYAVDEFGGDPHLMDLVAGIARLAVNVEGAARVPRLGPALLVANRGVGILEPLALMRAVRAAAGRRVRVVGAPELPVLGDALRAVGAIGHRPDDVAAMLRSGHLAAVPLSATWLRGGPGEPPRRLVVATMGFPVLPVAIRPGFPVGLPGRAWRVRFGETLRPPPGTPPDDRLAAAELAEAVHDAVRDLLDEAS